MNALEDPLPSDDGYLFGLTAHHSHVPDEPIRSTDGAALLDEVRAALTRYVVLPTPDAETAIVL